MDGASRDGGSQGKKSLILNVKVAEVLYACCGRTLARVRASSHDLVVLIPQVSSLFFAIYH